MIFVGMKSLSSFSLLILSTVLALSAAESETIDQCRASADGDATCGGNANKKSNSPHNETLISWLRSNGGFFHEKLELRPYDQSEGSGYGLFAKENIGEDETLFAIPRKIFISSEGSELDTCDTSRVLARELNLGEKSRYAPHIQYLKDTQRPGLIPSSWSSEGKALLLKLLGDSSRMHPKFPIDLQYENNCLDPHVPEESVTPLLKHAYQLVLLRSWDGLIIPIYDMISHRNGHWRNTNDPGDTVYVASLVKVDASRDIAAGEELYHSYDLCDDCGSRFTGYGTPELLRDYGFVESFPQRWFFDDNIGFGLDEDDEGNRELIWFGDEPDGDDVDFMLAELKRIISLDGYDERDEHLPESEWNTLVQYSDALITALFSAIYAVRPDESSCWIRDDNRLRCVDYDEFGEKSDALTKHDALQSMVHFESLETLDSAYQNIAFHWDVKTGDTCYDLDEVVQTCDSYRAHHNEMVVHNTARYIDEVEKVIFVGGGDSMLLHEIIKYPSLKKVVGLELDQMVTRYSFKHFGTPPHWDNDKVEWWYGDAAKSLLVLPKEYFGSFDMVLIDLSETVMSMAVTDDLDIFGALALLLKPDGILVKNGVYFDHLKDLFDYTVQLHFYGVPVVRSQALVYGSYGNDFLRKELNDHKVDAIFSQSVGGMSNRYDGWHDYQKNTTIPCKSHDQLETEPTEQVRSPGILMILEAEEATENLELVDKIKEKLVQALEGTGVHLISTAVSKSNDDDTSRIVLVLQEGYVVARTWPELKYCAFDIHLWSSWGKQEDVKKALLTAVGSGSSGKPSSSSYRIVAGGMFGVSTWKEDEKNRGPRHNRECDRSQEEEPSNDAPVEASTRSTILNQTLEMIDESNIMVVVICGNADAGHCEAFDSVSQNKHVLKAVPLWTCPGIVVPTIEDVDEYYDRMEACEADTLEIVKTSFDPGMKYRAIIMDSAVEKAMGRIVFKIFKSYAVELLSDSVMVIATVDNEADAWRRQFVHRFLHATPKEPSFRAEIMFNASDIHFELEVLSSGDAHFIEHMTEVTASVEEKTGLRSDTRSIRGALFNREDESKTKVAPFFQSDLDQGSPLEHWMSQRPLGVQTILQLQPSYPEHTPSRDRVLREGDAAVLFYQDEWLPCTVLDLNEDGTYEIEYDDNSVESNVKYDKNLVKIQSPEEQEEELRESLSNESVGSAVNGALTLMQITAEVHEFDDIGDGCVIVALWPEGTAVVVWDGRFHIDINWFGYNHMDSALSNDFEYHFNSRFPLLGTLLRDVQPRGTGRVVNFMRDIVDGEKPHWALSKEELLSLSNMGQLD